MAPVVELTLVVPLAGAEVTVTLAGLRGPYGSGVSLARTSMVTGVLDAVVVVGSLVAVGGMVRGCQSGLNSIAALVVALVCPVPSRFMT